MLKNSTSKKSNKARKRLNIVLVVIGIIIAIPAIWAAGLLLMGLRFFSLLGQVSNEHNSKDSSIVSAEIGRFSFMQKCSQKSRQDEEAGIDTHYAYIASYECPESTWGTLHDLVADDLHRLGYTATTDNLVAPPPNEPPYDTNSGDATFTYDSACCEVSIAPVFIDGYISTLDLTVYRAQPVKEYRIEVSTNQYSNPKSK
jgi:hypothetical protein